MKSELVRQVLALEELKGSGDNNSINLTLLRKEKAELELTRAKLLVKGGDAVAIGAEIAAVDSAIPVLQARILRAEKDDQSFDASAIAAARKAAAAVKRGILLVACGILRDRFNAVGALLNSWHRVDHFCFTGPALENAALDSMIALSGHGWEPSGRLDMVRALVTDKETFKPLAEAYGALDEDERGSQTSLSYVVQVIESANKALLVIPEGTGTTQPEVATEPEATTQPEVTTEPEAINQPEATAQPEATTQPDAFAQRKSRLQKPTA